MPDVLFLLFFLILAGAMFVQSIEGEYIWLYRCGVPIVLLLIWLIVAHNDRVKRADIENVDLHTINYKNKDNVLVSEYMYYNKNEGKLVSYLSKNDSGTQPSYVPTNLKQISVKYYKKWSYGVYFLGMFGNYEVYPLQVETEAK